MRSVVIGSFLFGLHIHIRRRLSEEEKMRMRIHQPGSVKESVYVPDPHTAVVGKEDEGERKRQTKRKRQGKWKEERKA